MNGLERQILGELFLLTVVASVIGLGVFGWIRRYNPLLSWNSHGNVWSSPFGIAELFLTAGVFYITWVAIQDARSEPPKVTMAGVLYTAVLFHGTLAGGVFLYFGWLRGLNLDELFGITRYKGWHLLGIALAWIVPAALSAFAAKFFIDTFVWPATGLELSEQNMVAALKEGGVGLKVAVAVSAVIVAPVAEETIFRGLIYGAVKRFSERYFAAVISALAFASLHLNLASFLPLFILGLFFALAYEISGCLAVPVIMHASFNAVSIGFILSVSAT